MEQSSHRTIQTATLTTPALTDKNGRVRSVATLPGYRAGQKPGNYGRTYHPEVLTIGEVDLLITGRSRTSASGLRDRALIALLYGSGLRISEALDLLPGDLTTENGAHRVLVRNGKGSKRRVVGMVPDAMPHIDAWMNKRVDMGIDKHCRLFCTIAQPNPGGPLGSPQVRTMLKRVATTAGIEKRVHPHGFRHSVAVDMARRGIPLVIIARQLGHENVATTSAYLRGLSDDEMFDTMATMSWAVDDDVPMIDPAACQIDTDEPDSSLNDTNHSKVLELANRVAEAQEVSR